MDIAKQISLLIQIISGSILLFQFFGIKPENIPQIFQPIFIISWYWYVIVFLIGLIFYLTRKEKISNIRIAAFSRGPLQKVGDLAYRGVMWEVKAPLPSSYESQYEYEKRLPDIIDVEVPPKCPMCGVELEETKGIIYGYIWKCVDCGFSKRNKDSYYTECKRAEKIWKGRCKAGSLTNE